MDQTVTSSHLRHGNGFSLVEVLVVIVIMVILMAVATPAVTSILTGSKMEQAGQMVADTLRLARQEAVSKNREVQVAFFELSTDSGGKAWIGMQVWRLDDSTNGPITNRVGRLLKLPSPMIISTNGGLSPLVTSSILTGTTNIAGNIGVTYKAFRFRANGATDSSIGVNNCLTVQDGHLPGHPPPNYFTVQVNPLTGKISTIRP